MTTTTLNRIVKKNLDFSSRFNIYLIKSSKVDLLPTGSCVVFADKNDKVFSTENAKLANDVIRDGGTCFVAEPNNNHWEVSKYVPA